MLKNMFNLLLINELMQTKIDGESYRHFTKVGG